MNRIRSAVVSAAGMVGKWSEQSREAVADVFAEPPETVLAAAIRLSEAAISTGQVSPEEGAAIVSIARNYPDSDLAHRIVLYATVAELSGRTDARIRVLQ